MTTEDIRDVIEQYKYGNISIVQAAKEILDMSSEPQNSDEEPPIIDNDFWFDKFNDKHPDEVFEILQSIPDKP